MKIEEAKKLIVLADTENIVPSDFSIEEQHELLKMALTYQEPWVVLTILESLQQKPNHLNQDDLMKFVGQEKLIWLRM